MFLRETVCLLQRVFLNGDPAKVESFWKKEGSAVLLKWEAQYSLVSSSFCNQ